MQDNKREMFSDIIRARGKHYQQRRSIQIPTTLLKYLFVIFPFLSLSLSFSPLVHTYTRARVPAQAIRKLDIFVRLHGSHSARPMERERHFNLPAHYFMTFLMTCFFAVIPEGRCLVLVTFDDLEVDELISNS